VELAVGGDAAVDAFTPALCVQLVLIQL